MNNINLVMNGNTFMYAVDYIKNGYGVMDNYKYFHDEKTGDFYFIMEQDVQNEPAKYLKRNCNEWGMFDNDPTIQNVGSGVCEPSILRLYFPEFSPETFKSNVQYALDVTVFIQHRPVSLGSFLINRSNTYAGQKVIKFHGEMYYECIDLKIIDPHDLLYSEGFEDVRKHIKEIEKDDDIECNNDSTPLYITLTPVGVGDTQSIYIIDDSIEGGQTSLNIESGLNDFLHYEISYIEDKNEIGIKVDVKFNNAYDNDMSEYMKETYGFNCVVSAEAIIALNKLSFSEVKYTFKPSDLTDKDNNDITYTFPFFDDEKPDIYNNIMCTVVDDDGKVHNDKLFSNWGYWEEGICFKSVLILYKQYDDECKEEFMKIYSNDIPVTPEMFSKLIVNNNPFNDTNYINLDEISMEVKNINVINNIENKISTYSSPEANRKITILPVFYRSRELGSIVLHPEVDENICINLDAYKSKVDTFVLQIEGMKFVEIGTTSAGTIFKIVGGQLPRRNTTGTYYILSQDYEFVTNGKYIYEY